MLKWLIDDEVLESALNGLLIEEESVECRPEVVPNAVLDEKVDIFLIKKYFTMMHGCWSRICWNKRKRTLFGSVRYVSTTYIQRHHLFVNYI